MPKAAPWTPEKDLQFYFTPSNSKNKEIWRTRNKNYNLSILQEMYNGDPLEPLKCLLSGQPGWTSIPCFVTGKQKIRFNIDINHIRQKCSKRGESIDKSNLQPSAIFNSKKLDDPENLEYLAELMTTMPVSQEIHSYISQDSSVGNLTLKNFPKKSWPWILRSKKNFDYFCKKYNVPFEYDWFIKHLSDIRYSNIVKRLKSA